MSRYFPLFVNLEGKRVLIYGAGQIAGRRMQALEDFGCSIEAVAPKASKHVELLAQKGAVKLWKREYQPGEIQEGTYFVLAATDDREVNRAIWRECKAKGIPVNVSSEKELCDFYFPGLAVQGDLVAGITAGGTDHSLARQASKEVREALERLSEATERKDKR